MREPRFIISTDDRSDHYEWTLRIPRNYLMDLKTVTGWRHRLRMSIFLLRLVWGEKEPK